MRVIKELVSISSDGQGTSIVNAMEYIGKVIKTKSIVILISDFIDVSYEKQLNIFSKKHDLLLVRINDQMEKEFPEKGLIFMQDAETGEHFTVDLSNRTWRQAFKNKTEKANEEWKNMLQKLKIDSIDLNTSSDCVVPLRNFFKKRSGRY